MVIITHFDPAIRWTFDSVFGTVTQRSWVVGYNSYKFFFDLYINPILDRTTDGGDKKTEFVVLFFFLFLLVPQFFFSIKIMARIPNRD